LYDPEGGSLSHVSSIIGINSHSKSQRRRAPASTRRLPNRGKKEEDLAVEGTVEGRRQTSSHGTRSLPNSSPRHAQGREVWVGRCRCALAGTVQSAISGAAIYHLIVTKLFGPYTTTIPSVPGQAAFSNLILKSPWTDAGGDVV